MNAEVSNQKAVGATTKSSTASICLELIQYLLRLSLQIDCREPVGKRAPGQCLETQAEQLLRQDIHNPQQTPTTGQTLTRTAKHLAVLPKKLRRLLEFKKKRHGFRLFFGEGLQVNGRPYLIGVTRLKNYLMKLHFQEKTELRKYFNTNRQSGS